MPARDVKSHLPAADYKTRVWEFVARNHRALAKKRLDFYFNFGRADDGENDLEPLARAMCSRPVVDLLGKTFAVPDGQGGTIALSGAQVMEWFDLLGEELCTEHHDGLVRKVFTGIAP